jgi:N-acyl-D-aspartate/D-glutamate deacylase
MEAGAFGLSSGPYYAPGSYSTTEELVELSKVAAGFGGAYASHIRDEGDYSVGVVAAVDEVIQVAREAQMPGIVTHIKALGPRVWGFSGALVQRIERAREQGIEVYADQYPYEASGSGITGALVPRWALVGGDSELVRRIDTPAERERLRTDMLENLDRRGGADRLQFRRHEADPSIEGKTLQQVADDRGVHPVDLAMDLLKVGGASFVSFNMHPEDVKTLMRQPWTITASDGDLVPMGEGVPHPRGYGTFPRKLHKYVVEEGVVHLATAIRSMTHLPAVALRMSDRGLVREGTVADLVVFDLTRVRDLATYQEPHQLAEGMVHVIVNGNLAMENGRYAKQRHGRVLSRRTK